MTATRPQATSVAGFASGVQDATGNLPDALVAGPAVAKDSGVLMLVDPTEGAENLTAPATYAVQMYETCGEADFFGGAATIPQAARDEIVAMIETVPSMPDAE